MKEEKKHVKIELPIEELKILKKYKQGEKD